MKTKDPYPIRKKMRFTDFDYSAQGCYFITIVTNNRVCLFGTIQDGEMLLNDAGYMIANLYLTIEQKFSKVSCMDSVVMPNHFHCILYCDRENSNNIPKVLDYFKSITTVECINGVKTKGWARFYQHLWQRNYWDDIIWNGRQFDFVRNYIALNPSRWLQDNINTNHCKDVDHVLATLKQLR